MSVYVDDAVFGGDEEFISEFKTHIESKYDLRCWEELDQNLGCRYKAIYDPDGDGEHRLITEMTDYCKDACHLLQLFTKARTGIDCKYSNAIRAPSQTQEMNETDDTPGIFAQDAPRFVGKWLYGMRACFPQLAFAVGELARKVTKWTR